MANGWGGRRSNQTGRPPKEETRQKFQMRAYPDEWEIVKRFARALKHGKRAACEKLLEEIEATE